MIIRFILHFAGLILLAGLLACEEKPDFNKVYHELPEDKYLIADTSLIFSGFGISTNDIENRINSDLGSELFKDKTYVNRGGVKMKLNVERTGKIELSGQNNQLIYKVPVRINGNILINETILGVKIRAEPGFELELTLNLASQFRFYNDFKYGITTKIENIDWPRKPVIHAGPIKIDLTEAIETVFKSNENILSDIINRTAKSEIKLEELVLKSVKEIPRYNYIRTKDIDLWIELNPQSLIIGSQPTIQNDTIKVRAGLRTLLNIVSQRKDSTLINISDLEFKTQNNIPDNFNIELKINISYKSLDTLLQKQIKRKAMIESLSENISISNLKTGKWDDSQIYLKADIAGKVKGLLINQGELKFDSITNSVYLDDMKSTFYSENWLWSLAYKFYFPGLKSSIEDKIRWPLDPLFIKVQESVKKLFLKLSPENDLNLNLNNLRYEIQEFNLRKDELELLIRIEGKSELNLAYKKSPI